MKRLFISYSHKDEALRAELDKHLALLRRQGELDIWSDHRIFAGEVIDAEISQALESADVIMLLLSSDFLASDYCFGVEMARAMEKHEKGEAVVLPVLLRPCDFHTAPFAKIKAAPTDARPVTKWPNQDEAFLDIVQHVRRLLGQRAAVAGQGPKAAAPALGAKKVTRSSNLSLPREFTDQDRHDFIRATFDYVRDFFKESLAALSERNPCIQGRLLNDAGDSFGAVIFRNGQRMAGCRIRLGGMFGSDGISYSNNENAGGNSTNELLSVGADKHSLHLKSSFGSFHRQTPDKLSQEGAAEHLWSLLIEPLQ